MAVNKKAVAFAGVLGAVVVLLIASHFIIAQDQLARQYSAKEFAETACKIGGTCATGSVLDPKTARAPNGVVELDPVSSSDSIIDQTADATQSPIFPGGSERIELVALVTKQDSAGNRVTERVSIELPTLSVVLDPKTGFDISTGLISTELFIKTQKELVQVNTMGTIQYVLNGKVVESYTVSDSGRTNNNGERKLTETQPLIFSFAKHVGTFTEDGISVIRLIVKDIVLEKDGIKYGISESDLYIAEFFKSNVITKVTNEKGGTDIIFPIDDKIKICAQNSFVPFDTSIENFGDPVAIPHPPMGNVKLVKPDGTTATIFNGVGVGTCSSATQCASTCTITDISRNSFYKIEYSDPILITNFTTPFSQKNYAFSCWYTDESRTARNCNIQP